MSLKMVSMSLSFSSDVGAAEFRIFEGQSNVAALLATTSLGWLTGLKFSVEGSAGWAAVWQPEQGHKRSISQKERLFRKARGLGEEPGDPRFPASKRQRSEAVELLWTDASVAALGLGDPLSVRLDRRTVPLLLSSEELLRALSDYLPDESRALHSSVQHNLRCLVSEERLLSKPALNGGLPSGALDLKDPAIIRHLMEAFTARADVAASFVSLLFRISDHFSEEMTAELCEAMRGSCARKAAALKAGPLEAHPHVRSQHGAVVIIRLLAAWDGFEAELLRLATAYPRTPVDDAANDERMSDSMVYLRKVRLVLREYRVSAGGVVSAAMARKWVTMLSVDEEVRAGGRWKQQVGVVDILGTVLHHLKRANPSFKDHVMSNKPWRSRQHCPCGLGIVAPEMREESILSVRLGWTLMDTFLEAHSKWTREGPTCACGTRTEIGAWRVTELSKRMFVSIAFPDDPQNQPVYTPLNMVPVINGMPFLSGTTSESLWEGVSASFASAKSEDGSLRDACHLQRLPDGSWVFLGPNMAPFPLSAEEAEAFWEDPSMAILDPQRRAERRLLRKAPGAADLERRAAEFGALHPFLLCFVATEGRADGLPPLSRNAQEETYHNLVVLGQGATGAVYRGTFGERALAVKQTLPRPSPSFWSAAAWQEIVVLMDLGAATRASSVASLITLNIDVRPGVLRRLSFGLPLYKNNIFVICGKDSTTVQKGKAMLGAVSGVTVMHALGYLHRDIKPANLALTNKGSAVVIDFGSAVKMRAGGWSLGEPTGTPGFAPPELIRACQNGGSLALCHPGSDVYGLAATLVCLMTWLVPADLEDAPQMAMADRNRVFAPNTLEGRYFLDRAELRENFDEAQMVVLRRCLATDAQRRPSLEEFRRRLVQPLCRAE